MGGLDPGLSVSGPHQPQGQGDLSVIGEGGPINWPPSWAWIRRLLPSRQRKRARLALVCFCSRRGASPPRPRMVSQPLVRKRGRKVTVPGAASLPATRGTRGGAGRAEAGRH